MTQFCICRSALVWRMLLESAYLTVFLFVRLFIWSTGFQALKRALFFLSSWSLLTLGLVFILCLAEATSNQPRSYIEGRRGQKQ